MGPTIIRLGRPARHDRRPVQRPFLAAGDAGADEVQTPLAHRLLAANRVGVERVAAVDDDVAFLHGVGQLLDDRVGRVTGLDHDDHAARLLQRGEEFFDGFGAHEFAFAAVLFQQRIGLGDRAVVQRNRIAVVGEIAREFDPITARPVTPICAVPVAVFDSELMYVASQASCVTLVGPLQSIAKAPAVAPAAG